MSISRSNANQSAPLRYTVGGGVQYITPVTTSVTTLPGGGITIGAGAPTLIQPAGSLYSRSDGVAGSRLYWSNGTIWIALL